MANSMKGSRVLRVVSVLWILFGLAILAVNGFEAASLIQMSMTVAGFWTPVILGIVWALVQMTAGVIGIMFWNRPEKAKICMAAALLTVSLCVVYNINIMGYGNVIWPLIGIAADIVLVVVYLLGAVYNQKLNA